MCSDDRAIGSGWGWHDTGPIDVEIYAGFFYAVGHIARPPESYYFVTPATVVSDWWGIHDIVTDNSNNTFAQTWGISPATNIYSVFSPFSFHQWIAFLTLSS